MKAFKTNAKSELKDIEDGGYSIKSVVLIAKEAQQEINRFWAIDKNNDLNDINKELHEIFSIMNSFLDNPNKEGLSKLASKSKWMDKACEKIEKFFQDNEMELPKKFTNNGHNGICTPLFSNTCCDAGKVLKYLS